MSDRQRVMVLSTEVESDRLVVGIFGPYETEAQASEHVGDLAGSRQAQRLRHGLRRGQQIFTSQHLLEDPSAFVERVEGLPMGREE